MYQLVIGMGWNALKTFFSRQNLSIWAKISQHKMLLNKAIKDYYLENAERDSLDDTVEQYLATIMNNHQQCVIDNTIKGNSIKDVFINGLKKYEYDEAVYVYRNDDTKCTNKVPSRIDMNSWKSEDNKNILNLYSYNSIVLLTSDESANKYVRFIKHVVHDEEIVNYIDPYILMNVDIAEAFCEDYIPMMRKHSTAKIYVKHTNENQDALKLQICDTAKCFNIKVQFYYCDERFMHDRYIVTSDMTLNIGVGLCFYKKIDQGYYVKESTSFNYSSRAENESAYVDKLAGKVIQRDM